MLDVKIHEQNVILTDSFSPKTYLNTGLSGILGDMVS